MTDKQLTFAGSTIGEPWWTLGEIVAEVLKPHGFQVTVLHETYSDHNIRWISAGRADVGAATPVLIQAALASEREYEGEEHKDLCSLATVKRPAWLALAVRHETGIKSLHDVRARQYPLRIMSGSAEEGRELDVVLRYHGTSLGEIAGWGGRYYRWLGRMESAYVREGSVDAMLGNTYLGYTPHNQYWHQATILYDMRFLDLEESLIEELVRRFGYQRGTLPHGILRGVDRDIATVSSDTIYIYCKRTLADETARLIVEGLDRNSDLFKTARSVLYYEREIVGTNPHIPLHPAAAAYYRSKGYIK